mmetsp:Transcript_3310/g.11658  ORF Transcript_3310/g.11658 Transcript_3310/m.11658 type:complete len:296 (+) Transcript_3310:172-1059(+)
MAWTPLVSPGGADRPGGAHIITGSSSRLSPPCLGALFSFWTSGLPLDLSLRCLPCCCCCCLGLCSGGGALEFLLLLLLLDRLLDFLCLWGWSPEPAAPPSRLPPSPPPLLGLAPAAEKDLGAPFPLPRCLVALLPRLMSPDWATSDLRSSSSFLRDASSSRSADCWSAAEEEEEFSTEVDDFSTDSCCNARSFFSLDSCSTASAQLDTGVTVSEVGVALRLLWAEDISLARFLGVGSCWALPCVRRSLLRASRHALQADWRTTAAHCALHLLSTRLALQLLCTTTAACSRRRRFL